MSLSSSSPLLPPLLSGPESSLLPSVGSDHRGGQLWRLGRVGGLGDGGPRMVGLGRNHGLGSLGTLCLHL